MKVDNVIFLLNTLPILYHCRFSFYGVKIHPTLNELPALAWAEPDIKKKQCRFMAC